MTPGEILRNGLQDQNPGLVQLLGLCPLLAVSTTFGSGLGLGLATLGVLVASNCAAALVGRHLPSQVRIAVFVLLIASLVTAVELSLAAWVPGLHAALGIFLPLIVTNCLLLARAEAFASRQSARHAALDGFAMGTGFLAVLVVLGAIREVLGRGSLGGDLQALLGAGAPVGIELFERQHGFLLAALPPGAFIVLGLLLALRQARRARGEVPAAQLAPPVPGAGA